ncbi:hypothetical protein O4H25_13770, partial [Staphylococcus equorum]|nr:hypothetical protein [Staphylococcus equorum]
LYIVPGMRRGGDSLFSTHPATDNRIAHLESIANEMGVLTPSPNFAAMPSSRGMGKASVPKTRRRASALDPNRRG